MTVVQPNSIAGINSISVQSGQSLSIHKSDGTLIREIVSDTGISTFSSISVGSATTTNNAAKSINIGLGASIAQHTDNSLTFGTNGDSRATIDSSGRFLIGTTTEGAATYAETLTIAGTTHCGMTIRSATNGVGSIYFSDGTSGSPEYRGYAEYHHDSDFLKFGTAATERLRITSGGLVGINTNTIGTNHNLEIFGNAGAYAVLNVKSQSLSHGACLELGAQDDDDYGQITQFASGAGEGARMKFVAGATETMNLRGGKVLIGATSNREIAGGHATLQVEKNTSEGISLTRTSADAGAIFLSLGKTRNGSVCQAGDKIGSISWNADDGTDLNHAAAEIHAEIVSGIGANDVPGDLVFKTNGGTTTTTERLRITSAGLVNIGGAAVSQSRTLNIGSDAEANLAIETHNDATSETANIRFYKSGNTGASPQVVETNDNIAQIQAYGYDGTDYACSAAAIKFSVDGAPGSNDMPGKIIFATTADGGTSPTTRLTIAADGNATFTGTVSDSKGDLRRVIENEPGGSAYQMVAADAGKFIHHNNTIKMPNAGQLSIGDMVTIYAYGALTLDCTKPDGGEALIYNAADASTGDRTFAARSLGTLLCVASNTYVLSGAGIS